MMRAAAAIGALFLLGGAVPLPDAVATHVSRMAADCTQVRGQFAVGPAIKHGYLDAGPEYWAVDEAGARCEGAATLFSGRGGSQVVVYVSRHGGAPEHAFESGSYGMTIEQQGDRSNIWITVGGKLCGQAGDPVFAETTSCERSLKWDAASETIKLAPLSEAHFPHASPIQAAPETVAYDIGTELTSPRTYVLQAHWRDRAASIDWKMPARSRGAIYNAPLNSADGRGLMVTMLQSTSVCDPLCPVRVLTADRRKIMEFMACSARDRHRISEDRRSLVACDKVFSIPQVSARVAVLDNAPPGTNREAFAEAIKYQQSKPAGLPEPDRVDSATHNGSQVLISEWKNGAVEITYDAPRPGLPVARGTLLFRGTKSGGQYSGTAYTFKTGCSPAPFVAAGVKDLDRETIVLTGAAPHRDARSCNWSSAPPQAVRTKLVFDTKFYGDE